MKIKTIVQLFGLVALLLSIFYYFNNNLPVTSQCPSSAQISIKKHSLEQLFFRCEEKKFFVDGREATLVSIDYYGSENCFSGGAPCVYNTYCAIVEGQSEYPYSAREVGNATLSDEFSGRSHWLATTKEFTEFMSVKPEMGTDIDSRLRMCN